MRDLCLLGNPENYLRRYLNRLMSLNMEPILSRFIRMLYPKEIGYSCMMTFLQQEELLKLLAEKLNAGFVPVRKPGKLPAAVFKQTYELEYGTDTIEIHTDAISQGDRILLHDDLLATGGTAKAACDLIEMIGGNLVQTLFIIELGFLGGREKLKNYKVDSLINYSAE